MSNDWLRPNQPWFWWFWAWLPRKPEIELTSTLSSAECRKKLGEAIAYQRGFSGVSTRNRFIGDVWPTGFYFTHKRLSLGQPGSWLFVCGQFHTLPHGTGIKAEFRFHPAGLLAFLAPIAMSIALMIEDAGLTRSSVWIWALMGVTLSMLAAGVWYRAWSDAAHRAEMLKYLRQSTGVAEPD